MSPNLKRILLILLLLAFSALIGYGLYFMFTYTRPSPPLQPSPVLPPGGVLPGAGTRPATTTGAGVEEGPVVLTPAGVIQETKPSYFQPQAVSQIVSDFAASPSLNKYGDMRYYSASDGKFYRVRSDGALEKMADRVFYGAQKVTWANNKDEAVIEYPDSSKIIYNFSTQKQVSLPKHWSDFSFSPDGSEIAAKSIGLSPENRWLVTIGDDGTGARLIEPMGENADKVTVSWSPSKQVVAFSQTGAPLGLERREVLLVGLNGENFKSLTVEGAGFQPAWSNTGKKLLYSVYSTRSDYKPELWITDSYGDEIGNNRQMLKINTWPDKCVFGDDNTLFCAVPRDLPQGSGMNREVAAGSFDDLYKIDLQTGLKNQIPMTENYQISNVSYDSASNKLFFTDAYKTGIFEAQL